MKTKLFFLAFLLLVTIAFSQTVDLLDENFNGSTLPSGWVITESGNGTHEWSFGSGEMMGGGIINNFTSNAAIFNDDVAGNTGLHNYNFLVFNNDYNGLDVSPYINTHEITLSYDYALATVNYELLRVSIYNDNTMSWIHLKTYDSNTSPTNDTIDLVAAISTHSIDPNDIIIAFSYDDVNSGWNWGAGIDNVRIYATPLTNPPANDHCVNTMGLPLGTDFNSAAIVGTLAYATDTYQSSQIDVWFYSTIPASGNLTIETRYHPSSQMHDAFMYVYASDNCVSLPIGVYDDSSGEGDFPKIVLNNQTPGDDIIILVEYDNDCTDPADTFQIATYEHTLSTVDTAIDGFRMYPNPATNTLNIEASNVIEKITLYNQLGKEVFQKTTDKSTTKIYINKLITGSYIVKVQIGNQVGAYRLLIE